MIVVPLGLLSGRYDAANGIYTTARRYMPSGFLFALSLI